MSWNVITVSKYDEVTNYDVVGNEIDGVIIKVGYRAYGNTATLISDTRFNTHYNGFLGKCKIGFYFFSSAITIQEAHAEANFVYNQIKDKHCDFPIYLESAFATVDRSGRADYLLKEDRTEYVKAFCDKIRELGYRAGVYATDNWFATELNLRDIYDNQYSILDVRHGNLRPVQVSGYDGWEYSDEIIYRDITNKGVTAGIHTAYFYNDVANWGGFPPGTQTDINDLTITLDKSDYTYTGNDVCPLVSVGGLKLGTDFTVEYSNNVNVGTGSITIKGIGNYIGTAYKDFEIVPRDIGDFSLYISPSTYTYTGERIKPNVNIGRLSEGVDYVMDCNDNLNIGTATVIVYGVNNYTGSMRGSFRIVNKTVEELDVEYQEVWTFTGEEIKPPVTIQGLVEGEDFEVFYANNINVGNGIINVTGINNYEGEVNKYFIIVEEEILDNKVTFNPPSFVYDGEPCIPEVSVEGIDPSDYDVEFRDNINAGTAKCTITGKNNVSGVINATFTIDKKPIDGYIIDPIDEYKFTNKPIEPPVTIPELVKGQDFSVQYRDNKNLGTATVIATGMGNYDGSVGTTFTIIPRPIGDCVAKVGRPSDYTPYRIDGPLTVMPEENGYIMQENLDYEIKNYTREGKETFIVVTYELIGLGSFVDEYTFITRVVDVEPPAPEGYDDGIYNFGDLDEGEGTAEGDYNFLNIAPPPVPPNDDSDEENEEDNDDIDLSDEDDYHTDIPDGTDFDFQAMSGIYTDGYDEDDGKHTGPDGEDIDPTDPYPDDLVYNFGDLEGLDPETAEGDYDFGDLDEGIDEDTVVVDEENYDFNIYGESDFIPGDEFDLEDTPIYANYCSSVSSGTRSGTYYVYKGNVLNNRVRLTKTESAIDNPVRCSGWFDIDDLANLGKFNIGQPVIVNGRVMKYTNGMGMYFEAHNQLMYIVDISSVTQYDYPYAVSYAQRTERVGWVAEDMMKKINRPEEYNIN